MRKATTMLLVAAFAVIGGQVAQAADRAGVGFEFGMGPKIVLGGGFDMQIDQAGAFTWQVSDNFAVSIFRGVGAYRGEYTYSDNDTADNVGNIDVERRVAINGNQEMSGMGFWASLPVISFLKVGFELGTMEFNEYDRDYSAADGSGSTANDFDSVGPGNYDSFDTNAMFEGIAGKLTFIRGNSKTVSADLSVMGALRFVQLQEDLYIYGYQEVEHPVGEQVAIDPISSFNHLDIKLVATIGF